MLCSAKPTRLPIDEVNGTILDKGKLHEIPGERRVQLGCVWHDSDTLPGKLVILFFVKDA
jgi:hypothetical protein